MSEPSGIAELEQLHVESNSECCRSLLINSLGPIVDIQVMRLSAS